MKIMFLSMLVTVFMFSLTVNVYSQVTPPLEINTYNAYHVTVMQGDMDAARFKTAFLKDVNSHPQAVQAYANDSPVNKMGQGAINALTSWVDVPSKITEESGERNVIAGCTLGLGEGLAVGLARTASGVYDMATFSAGPYNKPLMDPKYKVEKPEQEGFKVKLMKW